MASSEQSVEITYAQKKKPVRRMNVRKAYLGRVRVRVGVRVRVRARAWVGLRVGLRVGVRGRGKG